MIVVIKISDGVYLDEDNDHIYLLDVMLDLGIERFEIIEDIDDEE